MSSVVLVHGGFVDGSGWEAVYQLLRRAGHDVSIVQNPTISLTGDVAATKLVLDRLSDPTVLVGHSYGGAVITESGTHPNVAALVYISAFVPDRGESVNKLIGTFPTGGPLPPDPSSEGRLLVPRQGKVPRVVRWRRRPRPRRFHGGRPGALGRRGACRGDHRAGVEVQAKLVPRHDRGPHDPAGRSAIHGQEGECHSRRGRCESLRLRLAARGCRRPDRDCYQDDQLN